MDRTVRSWMASPEATLPPCRAGVSSNDSTGRPRHLGQREKKSPAGARPSVVASHEARVATCRALRQKIASAPAPPSALGISTEPAFASSAHVCTLRLAPRHPGPITVSREPCSLRQASGFSHECLLLSPRSAPSHAPAGPTPSLRSEFP